MCNIEQTEIDEIIQNISTDWGWALQDNDYAAWSNLYHRLGGMVALLYRIGPDDLYQPIYFLFEMARTHRRIQFLKEGGK